MLNIIIIFFILLFIHSGCTIKEQVLSTPKPFNTIAEKSPTEEEIPPTYIPETTYKSLEGCEKNLNLLGTALEMFATDHNGTYPDNLDILAPEYINNIPLCPSCGKNTYSKSYRASKNPDSYIIYCQGEYHKKSGLQKNFPQYSHGKGLMEGIKTKPDDNQKENTGKIKKEKYLYGCCGNLKNLSTCLEMYMVDYLTYPDNLQNLVKLGYIIHMPLCPSCGKNTYHYIKDKESDKYIIYCMGNHHKKEGIPPDYPRFENKVGLKEKP